MSKICVCLKFSSEFGNYGATRTRCPKGPEGLVNQNSLLHIHIDKITFTREMCAGLIESNYLSESNDSLTTDDHIIVKG